MDATLCFTSLVLQSTPHPSQLQSGHVAHAEPSTRVGPAMFRSPGPMLYSTPAALQALVRSPVPRRLELTFAAFNAVREGPLSPTTFWQCSAVGYSTSIELGTVVTLTSIFPTRMASLGSWPNNCRMSHRWLLIFQPRFLLLYFSPHKNHAWDLR